jgi:MFS family permease
MAGLLVGITQIFSAFAQPFMSFFFKRYKYRSILIVCCLVNIIGCVLYALGSATNWIGTILIGRIISGIVGGTLLYSATYVSRTTDQTTRSLYMQYMTVSIGIGYITFWLLRLYA